MTGRGTKGNAFEQERQEALESVVAGLAERPDNRITRLACAYLLRHLREDPEAEHSIPMAA